MGVLFLLVAGAYSSGVITCWIVYALHRPTIAEYTVTWEEADQFLRSL